MRLKTRFKQWASKIVSVVPLSVATAGARVLLYHSIVDDDQQDDQQLTTPLWLFEKHLSLLHTEGYIVTDCSTIVDYVRKGRSLPPKTVGLTFDDGYENVYRLAIPILQKYGMPATVFLVGSWVPRNGRAPGAELPLGLKHLQWKHIREMQQIALINFGCHSMTHRKLRGLSTRQLQAEIGDAKAALEDCLCSPVDLFAYPFGSTDAWDERTVESVLRSGFLGAYTSITGINTAHTNPFHLRRSRISWCDHVQQFHLQLIGSFDWYAYYQSTQGWWVREGTGKEESRYHWSH